MQCRRQLLLATVPQDLEPHLSTEGALHQEVIQGFGLLLAHRAGAIVAQFVAPAEEN
jgi:hypothetical protein